MPKTRFILPLYLALLTAIFPCSDCSAQSAAELYNRGEFNKAIKQYRSLANAGDLKGYLNLAVIFKDLCHYGQAIKVLKSARQDHPDDPQINNLLARMYFLNGEPHKAIGLLERSLQRNASIGIEELLLIGLSYGSMGRDEDASAYLKRALESNPGSVIAHLTLADIYYRSGRLKESDHEYKTVNLLDGSIRHIYSYWAAVLVKLGNYRQAYKIYEKMRSFDPSDPAVLFQLEMVRSKLGKAFFKEEKERRLAAKQQKKILVQPVRIPSDAARVRVCLLDGVNGFELVASTSYSIRAQSGNFLLGHGVAGQPCVVSAGPGDKVVCQLSGEEKIIAEEPVVFVPDDIRGTCTIFGIQASQGEFWGRQEDRSYRGVIEVKAFASKVKAVNALSMEEYLYGVVPSEMSASWPLEALKAQAIAARSEAIHKLGRHKEDGYDFCAEVHCQSYSGVERETAQTNMAVDETRGQVLCFEGKPIDAVYSSCCGGHTQDNIFGSEIGYVPYFCGLPDMDRPSPISFPLDPDGLEQWIKNPPEGILCNIPEFAKASNFRWVRIYSASEMDAMAAKIGDTGRVSKIVVTRRNPSGHISALKLIGKRSSYIIKKELNIRKSLGDLRSSMFKIDVRYDKDHNPIQFIFYGGGWGHGVGMCQAGACGMANKGKGYRDILAHYYKGTELKKLY